MSTDHPGPDVPAYPMPGRRGAVRRRKMALVTLLLVVLAAVGGALLGSRVASPAEIAAQTAAPPASPILVPAELRVLSTNVVTRGTGGFGTPREVALVPSAFKAGAQIATQLPAPGDAIAEGQVLATVSGRPLFLLEGKRPTYRDLGPGLEGYDVAQLERALRRLGFDPGLADGIYDDATAAAVSDMYQAAGFEPALATTQHVADIAAESGVLSAGVPGAGVVVPSDEVVFLAPLPIRVAELVVGLGREPDGPLMTITDADVTIDSSLPIEQSGLVAVGMAVRIDEPDLGIEAAGVVSRVADAPGTDGVDGFHVYLQVEVHDPPANLVNASVRLTIPIESTADDVLAVPVAALTLGADGSSRVHRQVDGRLEEVEVRPGLSAQGFVEVTPIGGELAPGDLVLVGFEQATTGE